MRLLSIVSLLGAAALGVAAEDVAPEAAPKAALPPGWTVFDGVQVPPLVDLTPSNFVEEMAKSKYMMVKLFSPYCHHCQHFAPTYQTLYEFYTTSKPVANDPSISFSDYYGFRFGAINCIAHYDFCVKHGVRSYPTTKVFKDGEPIEVFEGVKKMDELAKTIEVALEETHPGTRSVVLLPKEKELVHPTVADEAGAVITASAVVAAAAAPDTAAAPAAAVPDAAAPAAAAPAAAAPAAAAPAPAAPAVDAAAPAPAKAVPAGAIKDTSADSEKQSIVSKDTKDRKKDKSKKPVFPLFRGLPKSTAVANPHGASVPLNAETFQTLVTTTQDPWFIKFYAPWCHHCQAMAPNWEQMAKEMKGQLNIGEVNCEKEKRLCKDVHLNGYPTILFFRGGERVEYDGLRGLGDFVQYAEKAVDICQGVQNVNAAEFEALEKKEEVIFLYFYDFATTSEDFMALEQLPLSLIGRAKLVKTDDPVLYDRFKITTWPRLVVSREGRPTYYSPLTPNEMRDTRQVLDWIKSVWLPIVPELTASNAREIVDGKLVVLGILKRDDAEGFASAIREMKSAASEWMDKQIQLFQLERQELRDAKQLRIEEAEDRNDQRALRAAKSIHVNMDRADKKEVAFAWVDGVFWQRWLRTTYGIDVKDGERVVINDEDYRRYWDQTITGNPILPSRTSILETLNKVTASPPKIKPKLTISSIEKIFFDIRVTFSEHPYLTIGCFLGLSVGAASWFRGRVRWTRGHFRLQDSLGRTDFKLPILGTGLNTNGKVD